MTGIGIFFKIIRQCELHFKNPTQNLSFFSRKFTEDLISIRKKRNRSISCSSFSWSTKPFFYRFASKRDYDDRYKFRNETMKETDKMTYHPRFCHNLF